MIREISFRITDSHKIFDVVDAGEVPVLELFLSGHLHHLILLRFIAPAVAVLAVVALAYLPILAAHAALVHCGILGVFLGKQLGATAIGPGIVSGLQLGLDDPSGVDGEVIVWLQYISPGVVKVAGCETSELPPVPQPSQLRETCCHQRLCWQFLQLPIQRNQLVWSTELSLSAVTSTIAPGCCLDSVGSKSVLV